MADRPLCIALAGNPNVGKTTLFNRLTNRRAKVGNYSGVTVERVEGPMKTPSGREFRVIDLPGSYSLTANSPEEKVALDVILGKIENTARPDVIVAVVDASNLERNLYLVEQLREMQVPLVVALTMADVAEGRGLTISAPALSSLLHVPVVSMNARSGKGTEDLIAALDALEVKANPDILEPVVDMGLIAERYRRVETICAEIVSHPDEKVITQSDRLDAVLTHRVAGPICFLALMLLIFISIFSWAAPLMDLIDAGTGWFAGLMSSILPEGLIHDLVIDGVIAGVGNVIIFIPQIMILLMFLAILEDSGYMARAAFLMDRMMRSIGLSGRSFIPLLGSFACAIPGIMATRTIRSPQDRMTTIFVAPFMSCSARLPVYALVTAAFFTNPFRAGVVVCCMYLLGIAAAVFTAFLIKRVIYKSQPEPFLMELPPYRLPTLSNIWFMVWGRTKSFLRRAGTVILVITVILWFLMTFPRSEEIEADFAARRDAVELAAPADLDEQLTTLALQENSALLEASFAGKIGHFIEPVVKPLGFDWKIGIGLVASFAAREVIVSTLGLVYSIDEDVAGEDPLTVAEAMRADRWPDGRPLFTPLVGISILVFFVLAMQCMSTIAVVYRETNGWKWPLAQVAYMTGLAYIASLVVYQVGSLLGF